MACRVPRSKERVSGERTRHGAKQVLLRRFASPRESRAGRRSRSDWSFGEAAVRTSLAGRRHPHQREHLSSSPLRTGCWFPPRARAARMTSGSMYSHSSWRETIPSRLKWARPSLRPLIYSIARSRTRGHLDTASIWINSDPVESQGSHPPLFRLRVYTPPKRQRLALGTRSTTSDTGTSGADATSCLLSPRPLDVGVGRLARHLHTCVPADADEAVRKHVGGPQDVANSKANS